MQAPPHKLVIFMKRREGLSREAFRDDYERRHVPLCLRYMQGVTRYIRRYVQPLPDPATGAPAEMDYDVITEVWFDDRAIFEAVLAAAEADAMPEEVRRDEERLFDRERTRFTTVNEYETAC